MFAVHGGKFSALGLGVGVGEGVFGVPEVNGVGFGLVMAVIDGPEFPFRVGMVQPRRVIVLSDIQQVHYGLNFDVVLVLHSKSSHLLSSL